MAELEALHKLVQPIRDAGGELVALSPQTREKSAEMVSRRKLDFDLLEDRGNRYADALGLRFEVPEDLRGVYRDFGIDLEASNGDPSWTLPLPGRFIIDGTGTVRYARVHPDYTRRPEPQETLDALRML